MDSKPNRALLKIIMVLCCIGLFTSFYLIYTHYTAQGNCGIIAGEGCSIADSSIYSKFFGVPVALFGAIWFVFMIALVAQVIHGDKELIGTLFIWEVIGLVGVSYFIRAEILLGTICSLCTIVHAMIFVSFILTVLVYALAQEKPSLRHTPKRFRKWIIAILVLLILLIIVFRIISALKS